MALEHQVLIVFVMGELVQCKAGEVGFSDDRRCPSDNRFQFNTQVALEKDGRVRFTVLSFLPVLLKSWPWLGDWKASENPSLF
jgi:hypothetical protein